MTDQQMNCLQALNAETIRTYDQMRQLEPWQYNQRLELLNQYEAALGAMLKALRND